MKYQVLSEITPSESACEAEALINSASALNNIDRFMISSCSPRRCEPEQAEAEQCGRRGLRDCFDDRERRAGCVGEAEEGQMQSVGNRVPIHVDEAQVR